LLGKTFFLVDCPPLTILTAISTTSLMPFSQYLRLMDAMARVALKSDASKFFLGYLWWILEPLLYVAVFYVVFNMILESKRADFLIFLMCGKFPFIWFSKTVNQASNSIVANKGLIGRINIPKSLFPMSLVHEGLYRQSAVFTLLCGVLIAYGYEPSINWLWLLPVMLVNYLMIAGCALIGACLVCLVRDFSMVISLGMNFLLFTSGIFWDVRNLADPETSALILALNPLAFMLDAYRQVLMYQLAPDLIHLLYIGLGSLVVIGIMVVVMRRANQYLALKVLT
jgi:homopolymeric O-antigen transport system permease protein